MVKKIRFIQDKLLILLSFVILLLVLWPSVNPVLADYKDIPIRVLVLERVDDFKLDIVGSFKVFNLRNNTQIRKSRNIINKIVQVKGQNKISIGGFVYNADELGIIPEADDAGLNINKKRLGGRIYIYIKNNKLSVVNVLDLEEYLKGVVSAEVSFYWPIEVLKAQAVIARTFALSSIIDNKDNYFDVRTTIYSQVYGGRHHERYRTNQAIRLTKGLVLTYNGEPFSAFYHSTCSGMTENANTMWKIDLAPLSGVKCDYCRASPHFYWSVDMDKDELIKKLKGKGYNVNSIIDITASELTNSERIKQLEIISKEGKIQLSGKDFREILGPNIIRSLRFKLSVSESSVHFEGLGWGHGVGLCQWGAYYMAKQGFTSEEILEYYYPKAELKLIKEENIFK